MRDIALRLYLGAGSKLFGVRFICPVTVTGPGVTFADCTFTGSITD